MPTGWGGEDDDFSLNRMKKHNIQIVRFDRTVSRYRMLRHKQEARSADNEWLLHNVTANHSSEEDNDDGLSKLSYKVISHHTLPLFTHILVDL